MGDLGAVPHPCRLASGVLHGTAAFPPVETGSVPPRGHSASGGM